MVKKEGELLQNWVKRKGYKGQQIADMLGIERTSVYYVYKDAVLSKEYKDKLDEHGFSVDEELKLFENSQTENSENELSKLKNELILYKLLEARSQELIDQLKEKVKSQEAIIERLTNVKTKAGKV